MTTSVEASKLPIVLIAGGTGLIGKALCQELSASGYEIRLLTRKLQEDNPYKQFIWDPTKQSIDTNALNQVDHIVNLAGAGIADHAWTKAYLQLLIDSRVQSIETLKQALMLAPHQVKTWTQSSAIGYYGFDHPEIEASETMSSGQGTLAEITTLWEEAFEKVHISGLKKTSIRTGIVLSMQGGALPKIYLPMKYGFGSILGTGRQAFPWIHIDDLVQIFKRSIELSSFEGTFNAVAPEQINYAQVMYSLAQTTHKILWLPKVPSWILQLVLGKRASLLLEGKKVSSQKLINAGFKFKFNTTTQAFMEIFKIHL